MRMSSMFQATTRDVAKEEVSKNARLLLRAGYVNQLMAGVYSYLPMGLKVLQNIEQIVREEMNALGGQEVLMPAIHPREIWDKTGRWDTIDVLYKLKGAGDRDLALGPTHEEVITPLAVSVINSYKDLPQFPYQIQSKYRNEARAKSGVLRGREFRMKDLYSFHATQDDLDAFYERAIGAYMNVYRRCGLADVTKLTFASGGAFSKFSHEFQTLSESGEDVVHLVPNMEIALNKEVVDEHDALATVIDGYKAGDAEKYTTAKAIEVGNIFKLGTRFSEACGLMFTDRDGTRKHPVMGCYGIGTSRLIGTIAEVLGDEYGLVWPEEVAPYRVNLINLRAGDEACKAACDKLYADWQAQGITVLYDDREANAGEKFTDADLLGMPWQCVVGPKGVEKGMAEWKERATGLKTEAALGQVPFACSPR